MARENGRRECIFRKRLQSNHSLRHSRGMEVSKNELKRIKSLHQKKFRDELLMFLVEGRKPVTECMASSYEIAAVYTTDEMFHREHPLAMLISQRDMEQVSALQNPPGYLAVVCLPEPKRPEIWPNRLLALDKIQDPGNMGTILRTADWFGFNHVIAAPGSVEIFNPKVVQSTMGSLFRMMVYETPLFDELEKLKELGYAIIAADMAGTSVYDFQWPEKFVLVAGSESHGISGGVASILTDRVHIPGAGNTESLNVSVATGIILSMIYRG